jgi:pimeloyl-ACP methyl ester carboxylesterase
MPHPLSASALSVHLPWPAVSADGDTPVRPLRCPLASMPGFCGLGLDACLDRVLACRTSVVWCARPGWDGGRLYMPHPLDVCTHGPYGHCSVHRPRWGYRPHISCQHLRMAADAVHTPVPVDPPGWILYVSHSSQPVRRLVVFVHGFNGRAVGSWMNFPEVGQDREWWVNSDLLFVAYRSTKENITGVAHELRRRLPRYYPSPFAQAMVFESRIARADAAEYEELVVVGHSLGGLIVRRALCDEAQQWVESGQQSPRPKLLDATVRLFSPASEGFRAAGLLGLLQASTPWASIEMFLRRSSAYTDLQPGSPTLVATRRRTEDLVRRSGFDGLKAHIVWANPDNIVLTERYDTDWVDNSWNGTTHGSVCKPRQDTFEGPWDFVETGTA